MAMVLNSFCPLFIFVGLFVVDFVINYRIIHSHQNLQTNCTKVKNLTQFQEGLQFFLSNLMCMLSLSYWNIFQPSTYDISRQIKIASGESRDLTSSSQNNLFVD